MAYTVTRYFCDMAIDNHIAERYNIVVSDNLMRYIGGGDIPTIRERRLQLGLSQIQLAKLLHVTQSTISEWESGRKPPNLPHAMELAAVFGCRIDDLFLDRR